jgi:hypothetical protein
MMVGNGDKAIGRPPIPSEQRRTKTIKFVLTPIEEESLRQLAERKGCSSLHEYARQVIKRHMERSLVNGEQAAA